MSRLNYQNKMQGHRVGVPSNRDLEQKLTYQQLLNLNHDLSKENQQLKNIGNRLGQELKQLHSQFDIKPRNQNVDLYAAIGNHPILHQYQLTLIPLLQAYEQKIQNFQGGFQTINQEFINLQKKYEEVIIDNEKLRGLLNEKNTELIEMYKNSNSDKLGADFNQIILQQINEKQKFLIDENVRLEKQYQKYKSQSDKNSKELNDIKRKYEQISNKFKNLQLNHRQLQSQLTSLKENAFNLQMRNNEIQSEKKKIENDLERALSQINLLNKDRDGLFKNYQTLKTRYQKDLSSANQNSNQYNENHYGNSNGNTQQNALKATFEVVQHLNDDSHKKLAKLQKEYDALFKEKNKQKELQEQFKINIDQSTTKITQLKKKIDTLETQKRNLELSEVKNKKLLEQFIQKSKNDIQRVKKDHLQTTQRLQDDYFAKIQSKQKKINEIEQTLDKIRLQKDKLQQENIIHTTLNNQNKGNKNKDNDRVIQKLKEKLSINEELFKEQLHIIQNDNSYLKKEAQTYKEENKSKSQELRRLKQELEKIKKEITEIHEQKSIIIEEIKRVRNEYQVNLKDKERLFDQKIKEIKIVVQQSDKRRKIQRQKVSEASRQYKRVLQQIKNTYEQRIRVLQGQNAGYNSKVKKVQY